jgi:hypothetical protein
LKYLILLSLIQASDWLPQDLCLLRLALLSLILAHRFLI